MELEDYGLLKHGNALLDFSSCGKIRVLGKDRIEFLHNILTNDIKKLKPGENSLAALLHANGKTLSFMEVQVFEDHILLFLEAGFTEKTIALLDRYIIADDVQLEDASVQYALFYYIPSKNSAVAADFQSHLFLKNAGAFLWKTEEAAAKLKSFMEKTSAKLAGQKAYEMFRIENGILRFGKDFDESVILSETGLDKIAVSTTKGCYPGQEVIAKIETYDGLQRRIRAFSYEGKACPPPGTKILMKDDQEAGEIRSIAISPRLGKNLGFGYLSRRCPADMPVYFKLEEKTTELRREETVLC